ncbi:hypothetical protein N0V94_004215 [Neodidymelliopsis sp. IMI 364377]|nr:hypothetical protein N0V94_004215 [Neodidymelliopsis sp. IMI 364377]
MLVPQIWCVSIGSRYIITYGHITSDELSGTSVLLDPDTPLHDETEKDWHLKVQEIPDIPTTVAGQKSSVNNVASTENVLLFDGKLVEDFQVKKVNNTKAASTVPTQSKVQKAKTWHGVVHTPLADKPVLEKMLKPQNSIEGIVRKDHTEDQHPGTAPVRSQQSNVIGTSPATRFTKMRNGLVEPMPDNAEQLRFIRTMLRSIEEPELDADYLETFQTCMTSLLNNLREKDTTGDKLKDNRILSQLQRSLRTAEKLEKLCSLEQMNPDLAANPEYRTSLIRLLSIKSIQDELCILENAVKAATGLIRSQSLHNTKTAAVDNMPQSNNPKGSAHVGGEFEQLEKIARQSFLAWPWINADAGGRATDPELAAASLVTNLQIILQDCDDHIKNREDKSYTVAVEKTLTELDSLVSEVRTVMLDTVDDSIKDQSDTNETPQQQESTPQVHNATPSKAPSTQSREVDTARMIDTIIQTSKDLVALFIPYDDGHPGTSQ